MGNQQLKISACPMIISAPYVYQSVKVLSDKLDIISLLQCSILLPYHGKAWTEILWFDWISR